MPFANATRFPYEGEIDRLSRYEVNQKLLAGDHFSAFGILGSDEFSEKYNKLRYIVANFAGLISKVAGDFLFGEDATFTADVNQDFIDGLTYKNKLHVQLLESAISNSANGDDVFKIRVENGEIRIEECDPAIYFPTINPRSPRMHPNEQELAWIDSWETDGKKVKFLVREIYMPQFINIRIFTLEGGERIGAEVTDIDAYNEMYGTDYVALTKTNIDLPLLVHIPNFRYQGSKEFFGVSDYIDLPSLFFAVNNRITKTDNILDKHSDPILAVPEGILDDKGNVKKEALSMIQLGEDGQVPQYIVWNASLENAFTEIDKLVEFMFMFSETSPDALGMGKGGIAESGRALKMRLLRTIAKTKRKQRYYTQALQEIFEICQLLSAHNPDVGITYKDKKLTASTIEQVSIKYADGIIDDIVEEEDIISKRIADGTMSKKEAIMQLDNKNEAEAEKDIAEINADRAQFTSFLDTGFVPIEKSNQNIEE